jgi:Spy/CpxP family protein refolding chaperone
VVQELTLSTDQSARIDTVYRGAYAQLRQSKEELDRQEAELSRLIAISAEEAVVERQIDKVEALRASLNKTRTLMLLHMVRKLSPEQRAKFNPVHEQWRRDNPRASGQPPRAPPDVNRTPKDARNLVDRPSSPRGNADDTHNKLDSGDNPVAGRSRRAGIPSNLPKRAFRSSSAWRGAHRQRRTPLRVRMPGSRPRPLPIRDPWSGCRSTMR